MNRVVLAASVLLICAAPSAQGVGGSYGNMSWRGYATVEFFNGQYHFVLVGDFSPRRNIISYTGAPPFHLTPVHAAVLDSRSCIRGTSLYFFNVPAFDSYSEAKFGPLNGNGFQLMAANPAFGTGTIPRGADDTYGMAYCTVYEPGGMRFQGPCGEGPRCGGYVPPLWGIVLRISP